MGSKGSQLSQNKRKYPYHGLQIFLLLLFSFYYSKYTLITLLFSLPQTHQVYSCHRACPLARNILLRYPSGSAFSHLLKYHLAFLYQNISNSTHTTGILHLLLYLLFLFISYLFSYLAIFSWIAVHSYRIQILLKQCLYFFHYHFLSLTQLQCLDLVGYQ